MNDQIGTFADPCNLSFQQCHSQTTTLRGALRSLCCPASVSPPRNPHSNWRIAPRHQRAAARPMRFSVTIIKVIIRQRVTLIDPYIQRLGQDIEQTRIHSFQIDRQPDCISLSAQSDQHANLRLAVFGSTSHERQRCKHVSACGGGSAWISCRSPGCWLTSKPCKAFQLSSLSSSIPRRWQHTPSVPRRLSLS